MPLANRGDGYGQVPEVLHVPVVQTFPAQQGCPLPPQTAQLA
jgi:hypothetical protein